MAAPPAEDCGKHCLCGALVCRLTPRGVEIKCRRCKRVVVVPLSEPSPRER